MISIVLREYKVAQRAYVFALGHHCRGSRPWAKIKAANRAGRTPVVAAASVHPARCRAAEIELSLTVAHRCRGRVLVIAARSWHPAVCWKRCC